MQVAPSGLRLSATDLANHLACRHLTHLDLEAAHGRLERPRPPAALEVLFQRGDDHERAYVAWLEAEGRSIRRLGRDASVADTRAALESGVDLIVQAPLAHGRWSGYADVLRRVEVPSALGPWSYEVVDTKLASETKGGTVLQLCLYAELLSELQGRMPDTVAVVSPGDPFTEEPFRTAEFLAYHRLVKRRLEEAVAPVDDGGEARDGATYPEPVEKCDACAWRWTCDARRRDDDHLSLVAGIRRGQRRELVEREVQRLAELARVPVPLSWRPQRGSVEGYERAREQARVQLAQRERGEPVHELLEAGPGRGLARLPEPSAGDLFLDFEGDRYVAGGGLEYLVGFVAADGGTYRADWALDRRGEKAAFERLVDALLERRERFPDAHVYHFGAYEPAAMKRLMGRHATREEELDRLLRGQVLLDLHTVVKESLRAGVERYSLKELEPFHGFERELDLDEANGALRRVQRALELGTPEDVDAETRGRVERYNRDDCVSTRSLRDWLESLREQVVAAGKDVPRPEVRSGDPSETVSERSAEARELVERLVAGLPEDPGAWSPEERERHRLALLVEWHWRELKVAWWETYRLRDLAGEELVDERHAVGLVRHEGRVGKEKRSHLERFSFPPQEISVDVGDELFDRERKRVGQVFRLNEAEGWMDLKTTREDLPAVGDALLEDLVVTNDVLEKALRALASWVAGHGPDAPGPWRAARDLLLRRPPRLRGGGELRRPGEPAVAAARRLALELDQGLLAIQGPPGSGKTYTGARMIVELVRAGRRVGVTALGHKAIRNLLDEVVKAAGEEGCELRCMQKVKRRSDPAPAGIVEVTDNGRVDAALEEREVDVLGGTAWLWSRLAHPDRPAVDVLFVDEAGQLSLANVLAVATAARSVVLLGDPQQLEQPQQGAHPEGADTSALEHLLTDLNGDRHETIPPDLGLFLEETWRMHPALCGPLSELFYEGRLVPRPELADIRLVNAGRFDGAGFSFEPVEHEGSTSRSDEEVAAVVGLVGELLAPGTSWVDPEGQTRALEEDGVLVVAPYNAQVAALRRALPEKVRVGTVDRFQGQEAPVVIYSLTASSAEDAPRGLEFLFSTNRLNVALSRARCRAILVASPRLLEPECRTPRQMRLANALCRIREVAG